MAEQLIINFDPSNGSIAIGGSPNVMGNQVLAFGLLEIAKVAIIKQAEANERRVQPATLMPPGFPGAN